MSRRLLVDDDTSSESEAEKDEPSIIKVKPISASFFPDTSESEDEQRIVKSSKDKIIDLINDSISKIRNDMKIDDWNSLHSDFEELQKRITKYYQITKEDTPPEMYLTIFYHIEKHLKASMGHKSKMSTRNAKALNIMKQKLKKIAVTFGEEYSKIKIKIEKQEDDDSEDVKTNVDVENEIDEKKDDQLTQKDSKDSNKTQHKIRTDVSKIEDEQDDDFQDTSFLGPDSKFEPSDSLKDDDYDDSFSEEDDEEDDDDEIDLTSNKAMTREFWVKKKLDPQEDDTKERSKIPTKREQRRGERQKRAELAAKEKSTTEVEKEVEEKKKETTFTPEVVRKRLRDIMALRGKRGTNRQEIVDDLLLLSKKTTQPASLLRVRIALVSAIFDVSNNLPTYIPQDMWNNVVNEITEIITMLSSTPSVQRLTEDDDTVDKDKEDEKEKGKGEKVGHGYISGNLIAFLTNLSEHFTAALQKIDSHSQEYVERLKNEVVLVDLLRKTRKYFQQISLIKCEISIVLLHLNHIYYKYDEKLDSLSTIEKEKSNEKSNEKSKSDIDINEQKQKSEEESLSQYLGGLITPNDHEVFTLAMFVYKKGDIRAKAKAILHHIYHLAIHNIWFEARDMFLMSHLQETIHLADISDQILYNRVLAQLALCAFKTGRLREVLNCSGELLSAGRVRELLAQGLTQRYAERSAEQEKIERKRQIPYHMYINQDRIEATHLIAAMIYEVPNLALHPPDDKQYVMSKFYRRTLEHHSKQVYSGPPENTKDLIVAASFELSTGNWRSAQEKIHRLRMWQNMNHVEQIQKTLEKFLKETALRSYMINSSPHYITMDLNSIANMFGLKIHDSHRIISKMITSEELHAAWNQSSDTLIIHVHQPTRMQKMALKYADKLGTFVEQNEKSLELRSNKILFRT